jgi:hypothetical protein
MSNEWRWWLGEFGLAATVAVVAGFVTRDVPISILYGLFVGTGNIDAWLPSYVRAFLI